MLRVSPHGDEVWVLTASGRNVVLDARTLRKRHDQPLGSEPVTTAWSPDGRYNFTTQFGEDWVAIADARTYRLIKRLQIGPMGANVSFRPDGKFGYIAVTGADRIAVVDMASLEVAQLLRTGKMPMGLIVL